MPPHPPSKIGRASSPPAPPSSRLRVSPLVTPAEPEALIATKLGSQAGKSGAWRSEVSAFVGMTEAAGTKHLTRTTISVIRATPTNRRRNQRAERDTPVAAWFGHAVDQARPVQLCAFLARAAYVRRPDGMRRCGGFPPHAPGCVRTSTSAGAQSPATEYPLPIRQRWSAPALASAQAEMRRTTPAQPPAAYLLAFPQRKSWGRS